MFAEPGDMGVSAGRTPLSGSKSAQAKIVGNDYRGHIFSMGAKGDTVSKTSQVWSNTDRAEEEASLNIPQYTDLLDRIPFDVNAQAQFDSLLKLFEGCDENTKGRLRATVAYIECYRSDIIEAAEKSKINKTIYIRPPHDRKLAGKNNPFHIQVSVDSKGEAQIFFMPKQTVLGIGSFKTVRAAIDYSKGAFVASATMTIEDEKGFRNIMNESSILRDVLARLGMPFEYCLYELPKGSGAISKIKAKFIMPYANQGSLDAVINPKGHEKLASLTPSQKGALFKKLLLIIKVIHDEGYVISDVKPDNILFHKTGAGEIGVLITDFGTSYKEGDKAASKFGGSPSYIAPEQLRGILNSEEEGKIGKPVDIFCLGKTIWEVFVGGQPPWMQDTPSMIMGIYDTEKYADFWAEYGEALAFPEGSLEQLIHQMMNPDPDRRPTIDQIINSSPTLRIGSPNYQGIRLLTAKESQERLRNIRENREDAKQYSQAEVYTLRVSDIDPRGSKHFILERCPPAGPGTIQVPFENLEGGRVKTAVGKEYDSLNDYLIDEGLKYNANFYFYM